MYCRVVRSKLDRNRIDESIKGWDGTMVPTFKKQPGFAGQTATMNRATGDALTVTYWESEKAMQDSRPEVMAAAQKFLQAVGGQMVEQVDREVPVLERFHPPEGGVPGRVNIVPAPPSKSHHGIASFNDNVGAA